MMNEASDRDDFELDGPLWIQVHAHDKGLEILVTRGQISDGNMKLEIPVKEEDVEEENTELDELNKQVDSQYDQLEIIIGFREFEDVISLSQSVQPEFLTNSLYHYEGRYYLHIHFNNDHYTEDEQDNLLSRMLEFGYESELTIHRLKEYGKEIAVTNALSVIKQAF